jgi:hypothetical protein
MPVSPRIPEALRKRVAKRGQARQTTAHAFTREAIHEKLAVDEHRAAFHAEAQRRLAKDHIENVRSAVLFWRRTSSPPAGSVDN